NPRRRISSDSRHLLCADRRPESAPSEHCFGGGEQRSILVCLLGDMTMKDDSFEPIPLGALLALVLGSLASAVLTVGTAATFLMALMLTAGEARAAQPGERPAVAPAAQGAPAATAARAAQTAQTAPTRKTDARRPDRALVARGRYLVQTAG